ncbi:hypothetical protein, partial [Mesorhizobium sp.]|uniref:hypothetical protein n=1 Tax=Mesorhizobium sp. TaxID=1871066 RepID=UPI0025C049E5
RQGRRSGLGGAALATLVTIPFGLDRQVCLEKERQFHRDLEGDAATTEEVTDDLPQESPEVAAGGLD